MNADKNAWAIRILLAIILLCDIPVIIKLAGDLVIGGPRAVDGWIAHVALNG